MSDNSKPWIALAVFMIFVIILTSIAFVYGQTDGNVTLTTQSIPTPVVQTNEPIATEEDVFNQFLAGLGTTVVGVGGGVGALWAKIRGKTKRIDQALRGADFDTRDLFEIFNSVFIHADANPTMPLGDIIKQKAYMDKKLSDKTIKQAWSEQYDEYCEWFHQRYEINKE